MDLNLTNYQKKIISEMIEDAFCFGVDYGQLLQEEERDSEDIFDVFNCLHHARKYCLPSIPTKRRMPHSKKWRNAKKSSIKKYFNLLEKIYSIK